MNRPWAAALARSIDVSTLMKYINDISQLDRSLGSSDYNRAIAETSDLLDGYGVNTRSLIATMDGKVRFGNWAVPYAWEPTAARLELVSPIQKTIVDRDTTPTCVRSWSAATPPGGIVSEIIDAGGGLDPADYEGRDVRGKIALVKNGGNWQAYELAVKRFGALGVITDDIHELHPEKTRDEFPDMVLWYSLKEQEADGSFNRGWGFSISPREGDALRKMLAEGPVTVRAVIDAVTEARDLNVLAGRVGKSDGPAMAMVAHICHPRPAASDNVSGCAVLTEVARLTSALVSRGDLPSPERALDVVYGPEAHASNVYASQAPDLASLVAGIAIDMVAADPYRVRGDVRLIRTSDATPSFINDLVWWWMSVSHHQPTNMSKQFREFGRNYPGMNPLRFSEFPYGLYSDNTAMCGWGIPTVALCQWPHIFWHTQYDTVDLIVPQEMLKVIYAMGMVVCDVTCGRAPEIADIMRLVANRSEQRVLMAALGPSADEAGSADELAYIVERDAAAIRSSLSLASPLSSSDRDDLSREADRLCDELHELAAHWQSRARVSGPSTETHPKAGIRPQMIRKGVIDCKVIGAELSHYKTRLPAFLDYFSELACLADGSRTVDEIARVLNYELGGCDAGTVWDMITDLEKMGFVAVE